MEEEEEGTEGNVESSTKSFHVLRTLRGSSTGPHRPVSRKQVKCLQVTTEQTRSVVRDTTHDPKSHLYHAPRTET